MKINVNQIVPNPEQPRVDFDDQGIQSMANSILEHGLINPISVFRDGDHFVIIDGERRWRATKLAGLQ
jgi:ParB family transcriptional regulator, chromosome partitioning protein